MLKVGTVTRSSVALLVLARPSAAANAIRARRARRETLVGRRAQLVSLVRSLAVKVIGVGLGPRDTGSADLPDRL